MQVINIDSTLRRVEIDGQGASPANAHGAGWRRPCSFEEDRVQEVREQERTEAVGAKLKLVTLKNQP